MFNLSHSKFKKAATSLFKLLDDGAKVESNSQALQLLSKAFFSKTHEEVKETIFKDDSDKISAFRMFGIEKYFVFKGRTLVFCDSNCPRGVNPDAEHMSIRESDITLSKAIKKAKKEHGVDVTSLYFTDEIHYFDGNGNVVDVQENGVLESFKIKDVIKSAKLFGFFFSKSNPSLYNALTDSALFRVNGCVSIGCPNDDAAFDDDIYEDGENTVYWSPDGYAGQYEPMINFYFTLKEIAEAKYDAIQGCWFIIPDGCSEEHAYKVQVFEKLTPEA